MRTVDRAIRDGIKATRPGSRKLNEQVIGTFHGFPIESEGVDRSRPRSEARAKVIVADDVAAWSRADPQEKRLTDYGRLIPPWGTTWVEYPNATGHERRGTWTMSSRAPSLAAFRDDVDAGKGWWGDLVAGAVADAEGNGVDPAGPGHMATTLIYVEARKQIFGPVGAFCLVLDADGFLQGNRWMNFEMAHGDEKWMMAVLTPMLDTFELLHMRNVTLREHRPDPVRRDRKRGNLPPVRYSTLRLHLPRQGTAGGTGVGVGISPGQHIVAGHAAHYGDCCAGQHAPNKRLFGRHEGVYWVPSHLRGSRDHGTVTTDLEVTPE